MDCNLINIVVIGLTTAIAVNMLLSHELGLKRLKMFDNLVCLMTAVPRDLHK